MIPSPAEQDARNLAHQQARSDAVAAAIRAAIPDAAGLTALDYGCGPGRIGLRLADHFAGVILVDVDPEAVAQAEQAASGTPNASTLVLDLAATAPPPELRADVIVSSLAWHHVLDLDALLETLPVIAAGGRLLVADMDADGGAYHADRPDFDGVHGFDRADLVARVASHGYAKVTIADLWRGDKWVGGALVPVSLFLLSAHIPIRR